MSEPIAARASHAPHPGGRTAADLSSLLTELARALRASRDTKPDPATRAAVIDRAFLAFHVELERCGPIDLRMGEAGFDGTASGAVPAARLEDLIDALRHNDVRRIRFSAGLSRDAFYDLLRYLGGEAGGERPTACTGLDLEGANGGETTTPGEAQGNESLH